jgi:hypothetical protein
VDDYWAERTAVAYFSRPFQHGLECSVCIDCHLYGLQNYNMSLHELRPLSRMMMIMIIMMMMMMMMMII